MSSPDSQESQGLPRYLFLSDAPPLAEGHGCHIIATRIVEFFPAAFRSVITHDAPEGVRSVFGISVSLYPSLAWLRLPAFADAPKRCLELAIFLIWLLFRKLHFKRLGCDRLFVLFGSSGWFLFNALAVAVHLRLPMDVYLVDDLEQSARLCGRRHIARLFRWTEPVVLRRASRVYAISPGYCRHLKEKYGITAEWLPIPISTEGVTYTAPTVCRPDVRYISFLGGVSSLYVDAIRDLLRAITEWNEGQAQAFQLRLALLTYVPEPYIAAQLGNHKDMVILRGLSTAQRIERLRRSWIVFVPYGFRQDVRILVATSFPSKLAEAFMAGRPILVYGPGDSSIVQYFKSHDLPLCSTTFAELRRSLRSVVAEDRPELIEKYYSLLQALHGRRGMESRMSLELVG